MRIRKILIANRGEIAVRILRTCREMGIETVAIYSEIDRKAAHVLMADEAVCVGPADASSSYLNMEAIFDAASQTGVDAIHPGYGFLAENPEFARRCQEENRIFIGPSPEIIALLGDKTEARKRLNQHGLPVIPGTFGDEENAGLVKKAREMGFPVMVKAAAGGGGKGMRVVTSEEELEAAISSAAGEALAAFGNAQLYLEKQILSPRHIEVQILADHHGNVIHLLERECSAQRRHQKIVEECPSPVVTSELRERMGQAAVSAAKAVGYTNAGTFEFLVDDELNFYFLEVNTRIQVEHPVTEMVTGVDLVRQQILIAQKEPLAISQDQIFPKGHAIECRIYAEDPAQNFMPSPGVIASLVEPTGPGIRVDSGVYQGWSVPMEYDPILSKVIAYGENRDAAIQRMEGALKEMVLTGISSPVPFLKDLITSERFLEAMVTTDTLDHEIKAWNPTFPEEEALLAFVAHDLFGTTPKATTGKEVAQPSPWTQLGGFR
ncbi:MAG: acetyl-CoA carboxylase biotin carboxylase subunit, partial [Desulfobacterales bacterium]|nr:acetyl-CoA carboxylase biotin carboxylase subunit [Desulfobacterales bacterium]